MSFGEYDNIVATMSTYSAGEGAHPARVPKAWL